MIKTNTELVAVAKNVANNYKSIYVRGCFGWPMTAENKQRALNAQSFNRKDDRKAVIEAASTDTFGFDCVCFLKSFLWGWCGDASKQYGGAVYQSNDVPDISETDMLYECYDVSEDFSNIVPGEYLWTDGHCGLYVGDGIATECTYRWNDGVQETYVFNIVGDNGQNGRYWKKHGKLPYITYEMTNNQPQTPMQDGWLYKGCISEDVRTLQNNLIALGYDVGADGADGDFGGKTEQAVVQFQKDNGLEVDGIVGPATKAMIDQKLQEKNEPVVEQPPIIEESKNEVVEDLISEDNKSTIFTKIVKFILDFVVRVIKLFIDKQD